MGQTDDHWGAEDEEVVRRLREEKPQLSAFELDRVKTTVMAKARPSASGSRAPRRSLRARFLVAALTLGLMVAGTAGAVAGSSGTSGVSPSNVTGAAQSQYTYPCQNAKYPLICECLHHPIICACLLIGLKRCLALIGLPPDQVTDDKRAAVGVVGDTTRRTSATTKLLKLAGARGSPGVLSFGSSGGVSGARGGTGL